MNGRMLTIVEEGTATTKLDSLSQQHRRLGEIWDALIWVISRQPRFGERVPHHSRSGDIYILKSSPYFNSVDIPTLTLLYQVEENQITVLDLKVT